MEQRAAQQAQQTVSSLQPTSSSRRTSLTDTLRGLTMRNSGPGASGGQGGVLGGAGDGASASATPVPEMATKSVAAHAGGCFTCAFDR